MLEALKKEAEYTLTENGALTWKTTNSECLDFFAAAGGLRDAEAEEIVKRFVRAYAEDPALAMKLLFYTRDVRGGLGERRIFREVVRYLCRNHAGSVIRNIPLFAEYGRYDDLLLLADTPCEAAMMHYLKLQFNKDIEEYAKGGTNISLLAKWLPSVNTSNADQVRLGKKLAKAFGMQERAYRKNLSVLRRQIDIIENRLRESDYTFDYSKQCGKSMLKYRKAFLRHDEERYKAFMDRVSFGEAAMHTSTLMPYEIIRPFIGWYGANTVSEDEARALDVTWNALEDYAGDQNALVVIDGSGSMYTRQNPSPAAVAQSLGLYFAERNKGAFANHFITFSSCPQLIEVKGKGLKEKLHYISSFDEVADTNIQAVFDLILAAAVKGQVPQSEMPERIIIVSDMEFNWCAEDASLTNFQAAQKKFTEAGYRLPQVVFWNVASRARQVPVQMNEQGVILVSGCTARLFEQVCSGAADPYQYMMEVLGAPRYEPVAA